MTVLPWLIKGFFMFLLEVGFIVDALGIYLLFQCKFRKKIHRIILSFTSLLTIILILHSLITDVCQLNSCLKKQMKTILHINCTVNSGVFITYYITIAVLTLDRLVCLVNSVIYRVRSSKTKKIMTILICCCVLYVLSLSPFL